MENITESDLIDIATRLAQELQEFVDEAADAGCDNPFPGTIALLEEWEEVFRRTEFYWQTALLNNDSADEDHEGLLNCL